MKTPVLKRTLYLPLVIIFVGFISFFVIQFILNLAGINIGFQPELDAHEMWYVP
jgi:hypothetical protein